MSEDIESSALEAEGSIDEKPQSPATLEAEAGAVRSSMLHVIQGGDVAESPDAGMITNKDELIGSLRLKDQYDDIISVLQEFGLYTEEDCDFDLPPLPTYQQVVDSLGRQKLKLATTYADPSLLLVPPLSLADKIGAIDSRVQNVKIYRNHRIIYTTDIDSAYTDSGVAHGNNWEIVIAEGMPEAGVFDWDDRERSLKERVSVAMEKRTKLEKYVDPDIYAMLIMRAMRQGKPIDSGSRTIFPGYQPDVKSPTHFPRVYEGRWDSGAKAPVFGWSAPSHVKPDALFRPYIKGQLGKKLK